MRPLSSAWGKGERGVCLSKSRMFANPKEIHTGQVLLASNAVSDYLKNYTIQVGVIDYDTVANSLGASHL